MITLQDLRSHPAFKGETAVSEEEFEVLNKKLLTLFLSVEEVGFSKTIKICDPLLGAVLFGYLYRRIEEKIGG